MRRLRGRWPALLLVATLALLAGCGSAPGRAGSTARVGTPAASVTPLDPADPDGEPTTITRYDADFHIVESGRMDVTEGLTVSFPEDVIRHGIRRTFREAPGHVQRFPADVSVLQDGRPAATEVQRHRHSRVLWIGAADTVLRPGQHTYLISYRYDGVLSGDDDAIQRLHWPLVPAGWQQRIDRTRLRVFLPAAATAARCTAGRVTCSVHGRHTRVLHIETGALPAKTPIVLRARLAPH
ncbi:DUF2207 domain-containing protein [Nocardioides terrisoli]|uniref:DUF2207 domain-containing protein n=1 Tax=Nocardioides terrisoli TaxID=3388267 RepID=UPI00287B7776|nr:DUF2207 domain-containing protein [Nocardioides marmorisolisilvae]